MWQISKPIIRFGQSAMVGLICRRARKRRLIEGWAAPWAGVPWGAGRACHAGSRRHASLPGTAGSVAVVRVFALPLHSPASRVCSAGGAQPRPPSTLPACAGTQGAVGACVFATAPRRFTARLAPVCSALRAQPPTPTAPCVPAPARLLGRPLPAWQSLPRAPHGTPAHGATALGSCACVACAHRRRQRRRLRRSLCPGRS